MQKKKKKENIFLNLLSFLPQIYWHNLKGGRFHTKMQECGEPPWLSPSISVNVWLSDQLLLETKCLFLCHISLNINKNDFYRIGFYYH